MNISLMSTSGSYKTQTPAKYLIKKTRQNNLEPCKVICVHYFVHPMNM